jgi:hypothetical protein
MGRGNPNWREELVVGDIVKYDDKSWHIVAIDYDSYQVTIEGEDDSSIQCIDIGDLE